MVQINEHYTYISVIEPKQKLKGKYHMTVSTDTENSVDKVHYPFTKL